MAKHFIQIFIAVAVTWLAPLEVLAQTCEPSATFVYTVTENGESKEVEETSDSFSGSAPVTGRFTANPSNYDGYSANYTWHIYASDKDWNSYEVTRSDESIEYTFSQSGSYFVELRVTFTNNQNGDEVIYPEEGDPPARFSVTVSESKLEMPNAFSPNGDGKNDVYKAKSTHQSIVEFKAIIFNRWGQKLYQWNDVNGGWDGTVNGKTVKDGVYFVNVVAKGADGVEYKIRKDVNVLTRFKENEEGDE